MEEVIEQIKNEYERCLCPTAETLAIELYGISEDQKADYYEWRAEGLGFALDRLGRVT